MEAIRPLDVVHSGIVKNSDTPDLKLEVGCTQFFFTGNYPSGCEPLFPAVSLKVMVEWRESQRILAVATLLDSDPFKVWKEATTYLDHVSDVVSLFTEKSAGRLRPLTLPEEDGKGLVRLGHVANIKCPVGYDTEGLSITFEDCHTAASQSLMLVRPLAEKFFSKQEMPPDDEVLRTCAIEFEKFDTYCVYHSKERPRPPRWGGSSSTTIN